jgi:hypothetical protein
MNHPGELPVFHGISAGAVARTPTVRRRYLRRYCRPTAGREPPRGEPELSQRPGESQASAARAGRDAREDRRIKASRALVPASRMATRTPVEMGLAPVQRRDGPGRVPGLDSSIPWRRRGWLQRHRLAPPARSARPGSVAGLHLLGPGRPSTCAGPGFEYAVLPSPLHRLIPWQRSRRCRSRRSSASSTSSSTAGVRPTRCSGPWPGCAITSRSRTRWCEQRAPGCSARRPRP